jgi:hypothetical protein
MRAPALGRELRHAHVRPGLSGVRGGDGGAAEGDGPLRVPGAVGPVVAERDRAAGHAGQDVRRRDDVARPDQRAGAGEPVAAVRHQDAPDRAVRRHFGRQVHPLPLQQGSVGDVHGGHSGFARARRHPEDYGNLRAANIP